MARMRTFVAIELTPTIRARAAALRESLARTAPDVKWAEADNLHVTLLFLGEVRDRDVLEVCRAVGRCCAASSRFPISVEGVGCFPTLRRPRVVWIGVGEGAEELKTLHAGLEESLLDLGCYRREERAFTPHITLGRLKQEEASPELIDAIAAKETWQAGEFDVTEVQVMSSELTSRGPIYSVLSRARLG